MKLNLSLTPKPAQRCAQAAETETPVLKVRSLAPAACTVRKNSPFDLLTARANRPIRIPAPIIVARPVLRGDKAYLRALRAAEMALWEANLKFPAFGALLLATLAI